MTTVRETIGRWAAPLVTGLVTGLLVGCGPVVELADGSDGSDDSGTASTSTSGSPDPTAPPPGTTTTPPPPGTTTAVPPPSEDTTIGAEDSGFSFIEPDDGPWGDGGCDIFAQDCPRGEKCMPWANDGGSTWNSTRCSPVVGDPAAVGEPCLVEGGPFSGIDSCDHGSMCWDVDPETNEGHCVALCTGSPDNPVCEDESTSCVMDGDADLAVCLPGCNPLLQDCGEGQGCYPVGGEFQCAPDGSGDAGGPGDPCDSIPGCDPGLLCAQAELVPGCLDLGCCTPFCELGDAMPPCLPGQECTPWFPEGTAPPGLETVGACAPPPIEEAMRGRAMAPR